jgi:hypothetical protein
VCVVSLGSGAKINNDDTKVPMGAVTRHGRNGDCISIQQASCYLNVLKSRLIVYFGEDRVRKSVDYLLNRRCVAWRHAGAICVYEGRGLLDGDNLKEINLD